MDDRIFLKPLKAVIRDPKTSAILPADGAWKKKGSYWARRLRDGDVVEAKPVHQPKQAKAATPAKAAKPAKIITATATSSKGEQGDV